MSLMGTMLDCDVYVDLCCEYLVKNGLIEGSINLTFLDILAS